LARLPACFLSGCLGPPRAPLFPYTTLFRSSPHSHYDFDQCSLIFEGNYIHHLRWPWSSNKHEWRADEHIEIGSPSVTIIPARVIDRKSTRLNSSHVKSSYAVCCLKKKKSDS